MRAQVKQLAVASALAVLGSGAAQASLLSITASGGSETLLNIVSTTDSSSISLDLGDQIGGLAIGDTFDLSQGVLDFISNAGGIDSVRFAVVAGLATNGTSVATYLHSSDNTSLTSIANGVRGTWFSNLNNLVTNRLNASIPLDTDTSVNNTYGPFASGLNGNYLTNGSDDWGTAGTCAANDNVCNLVPGSQSANLFLINFGTSPTGFASVQRLLDSLDATASMDLQARKLRIGSVVPVPAAIWLMGSALGLLGIARRRQVAR